MNLTSSAKLAKVSRLDRVAIPTQSQFCPSGPIDLPNKLTKMLSFVFRKLFAKVYKPTDTPIPSFNDVKARGIHTNPILPSENARIFGSPNSIRVVLRTDLKDTNIVDSITPTATTEVMSKIIGNNNVTENCSHESLVSVLEDYLKRKDFYYDNDKHKHEEIEKLTGLKMSEITDVSVLKRSFKDHTLNWSVDNSDNSKVVRVNNNGLVGSCILAYNLHKPIEFRPDDFLLLLGIQVSFCMEKNAKKYMTNLVYHEGKKELSVKVRSVKDMDLFIGKVVEKIKAEASGTLLNALTPEFTTTTNVDILVANATLMSVYKHYFNYNISVGCGLPEVVLLGTVEDWVLLREKCKSVKKIMTDMDVFFDKFDQVIEGLVKTRLLSSSKETDYPEVTEFWADMCKRTSVTGYLPEPAYDGWILYLDAYSKSGYLKPQVTKREEESFTQTVVSCNLKLTVGDQEYQAKLYAGLLASKIDERGRVKTVSGCFVSW